MREENDRSLDSDIERRNMGDGKKGNRKGHRKKCQ